MENQAFAHTTMVLEVCAAMTQPSPKAAVAIESRIFPDNSAEGDPLKIVLWVILCTLLFCWGKSSFNEPELKKSHVDCASLRALRMPHACTQLCRSGTPLLRSAACTSNVKKDQDLYARLVQSFRFRQSFH